MKHIGGFFELEPAGSSSAPIHAQGHALSTGRACLAVMLARLKPTRVYVPHYTCDATLSPFMEQGISTVFYGIDKQWSPLEIPVLGEGEYFLYTNYFGLCEAQVQRLHRQFGQRLIVDDTHGFFRGRRQGLWSFTSARKAFGVPDGAYLYSPEALVLDPPKFNSVSIEHLELRRCGKQEEGFTAYQAYEASLDSRVLAISDFSRGRLAGIDYAAAARARRENFHALDRVLASRNVLNLEPDDAVPFCYPFLPRDDISRDKLYRKQIYPPTLWTDVLKRDSPAFERHLARELLPLPVDHRYGVVDMEFIVESLG